MTVHAVRLSRLSRAPTLTAKNVFPPCNRLKVVRINAVADAAQVIQAQPLWYGPAKDCVDHAVG